MELLVYADSIVLLMLPIEFGLLELIDIGHGNSAFTRKVFAALVGTIFYLMSFGGGKSYRLRTILCILIGNGLMLRIAFPMKGFKTFLNTLEEYLKESVFLGGILTLIRKVIPLRRFGVWRTWGMVVLIDFVLIILCGRLKKQKNRKNVCKVILRQEGKKMDLDAVLDTGNTLTEPISGEPVCIIPSDVLEYLWKQDALFRMIPFCSIDQKGMLKAYRLDELTINLNGHIKKCRKVYVAACDQSVNKEIHKVILNPNILKR